MAEDRITLKDYLEQLDDKLDAKIELAASRAATAAIQQADAKFAPLTLVKDVSDLKGKVDKLSGWRQYVLGAVVVFLFMVNFFKDQLVHIFVTQK